MDQGNLRNLKSAILKVSLWSVLILGFGMTAAGVSLYFTFPTLMGRKIQKFFSEHDTIGLVDDGLITRSQHTYVYVYLLNVTNPNEVNEGSEKPNLADIGPFVFKKLKQKIISMDDEGLPVYKERQTLIFERFRSVGYPKDIFVYHVNAPDIECENCAIYDLKKGDFASGYYVFNTGYNVGPIVVKHSASDLMLTGYNLQLFDKYRHQHGRFLLSPKNLNGKTFGLFYQMNNTLGKEIHIQSETRGSNKLNILPKPVDAHKFRILTTCNEKESQLNLEDAVKVPALTKNSNVSSFVPELCRYSDLLYLDSSEVEDVDVYRYSISKIDKNEDTTCFCSRSFRVITAPHFLKEQSNSLNEFSGLSPDYQEHRSLIYVEPITGFILKSEIRMQVNTELKNFQENILFTGGSTKFFFPLSWLNEEETVDSSILREFHKRITYPIKYGTNAIYITIACGTVSLILSVVYLTTERYAKKNPVPAAL